VQRLIRFMPKVVIAVVPGWAVGGGHSLHVVCDMTLASAEHAIFKQTDADVASFDAGYGSAYLARMVGQKRAREIFFLGRNYSAREVNGKSPTAQRMLKFAFNMVDDGLVGQQLFAGEATRLAYGTDEAVEGRNAFLEKRDQDFTDFPWHY
jgi:naphthoate synthase